MKIALLIRVSTEKQEKQGESLANQEAVLRENINRLNADCLPYIGQEHATVDSNRQQLDKLMEDAKAGKFQAIMVYDPSRWSRDNGKSREYLDKLRDLGIRFFCGLQEFNLRNEQDRLFLHMSTEFNEYAARQMKRKSLESRLHRIRNGIPAVGKKPFGRIWNKETQKWEIDPDKQALINEIANKYLSEDISWKELGKLYGINSTYLNKTIRENCGDIWLLNFDVPELQVKETIAMSMPRLLPEEIISAINEKSKNRKTWDKITSKYDYLFSKLIFDADTGLALTGLANSRKVRYYRAQNIKPRYSVNAERLETEIVNLLFETLANQKSLSQAVFDGNPIIEIQEKLLDEIKLQNKLINTLQKKINNLMSAIENTGISDLINERLLVLKEQKTDIINKIESLNNQLISLPSKEDIKTAALSLRELINIGVKKSQDRCYVSSGAAFHHLPFKDKRKIITMIFGGYDNNKKRYGIYVKCVKWSVPREFEIEAYGRIGKINSILKQNDTSEQLIENTEINKGIADLIKENNKQLLYESKAPWQCHAYKVIPLIPFIIRKNLSSYLPKDKIILPKDKIRINY